MHATTTGPHANDAIMSEPGEAMPGNMHAMGTTNPHPWDRFTAVCACLGPVNANTTTAPDQAPPRRPTRSRTGYRRSLTLSTTTPTAPTTRSSRCRPPPITRRRRRHKRPSPPSCAAAPRTSHSVPTCPRSWKPHPSATPPTCCAPSPSPPPHHQAEATRLEQEARTTHPARRAAEAAW